MTQRFITCSETRRTLRRALSELRWAALDLELASKRAQRALRPFWPDSVTSLLWLLNGFGLGLFLLSIWFATY